MPASEDKEGQDCIEKDGHEVIYIIEQITQYKQHAKF